MGGDDRRLRIGVVGGMGPAASNYFANRLTELTPATRDQDHPVIIHLNDAGVPDRTDFIVNGGEDPVPYIVATVSQLLLLSPDVLCMPCNTAHSPEIFDRVLGSSGDVPIVNMIDETVKTLSGSSGTNSACVLATDGTLESNVYHQAAQRHGISIIRPEPKQQKLIMNLIYRIKSGSFEHEAAGVLEEVAKTVNADAFIVACTELSMLTKHWRSLAGNRHIVDSLDVLARRVLEFKPIASRTAVPSIMQELMLAK